MSIGSRLLPERNRAPWRLLFGALLGRRLPITQGNLEVPALVDPVQVGRDEHGVVYVSAAHSSDAWFGLGFCQGQDRAFQLECLARVVRGTLAEALGPSAIDIDRLARRLGFRRIAEAQLGTLDAAIAGSLEAFARGVGEGMRRGARRYAHELALLRIPPTPFDAADVLGVSKLMGLALSANWDLELARLKVLAEDGPEALTALHPFYAEEPEAGFDRGPALSAAVDSVGDAIGGFLGLGGASNAFALAGSRTASGRALVANDVHLDPSLPNYFYLASVRTPEWGVAGAALAGTPVVVTGHNGTVAWGVTAGLVDNTDLFIEDIGPDRRSVREGEHFVPCRCITERIAVRGGPPVTEQVLVTERGPIIGADPTGRVGISLSATWLDPRPMEGLFRAHRARTCAQMRADMRAWPSVSLNVVAADSTGSISHQLIGGVPRRRKGYGSVPRAGGDPGAGWAADRVAFEDMPHVGDPGSGFVCNANNEPPNHRGPFLGRDWIDDYRFDRLTEVLSARSDWNLAGAGSLQMDLHSMPWRRLRPVLLAIPCDTADARRACLLLAGWDGWLGATSAPAAVFELFLAEMARRVVAHKAIRSMEWGVGRGVTPLTSFSAMGLRQVSFLCTLLVDQPEGWFERPWPQEMSDALGAVIARLRARRGPRAGDWAWGRVRPLRFPHPAGARKPLDLVFNAGPLPWGGDVNSVSQAAAPPLDALGNPLLVATTRMVVEVGEWDAARFVIAGGQSGNPCSRNYEDLLGPWRRGEGIPIAWSGRMRAEVIRSTLTLSPHLGPAKGGPSAPDL
jgi:penicillin amidase